MVGQNSIRLIKSTEITIDIVYKMSSFSFLINVGECLRLLLLYLATAAVIWVIIFYYDILVYYMNSIYCHLSMLESMLFLTSEHPRGHKVVFIWLLFRLKQTPKLNSEHYCMYHSEFLFKLDNGQCTCKCMPLISISLFVSRWQCNA